MNCTFEQMSQEHENTVMNIFNYYCENSFNAYPEGKIPNHFFSHFLDIAKTYPAFVVKVGNDIAGFCLLRPYNPFQTFKETAEASYFIKKEYTRKGIGSQILIKLEETAKKMGIKKLLVDISSENKQSIDFHLKNKFNICGTFKGIGKKLDKNFDVIWMQKDL